MLKIIVWTVYFMVAQKLQELFYQWATVLLEYLDHHETLYRLDNDSTDLQRGELFVKL